MLQLTNQNPKIVAVDGHAGSGKSTICQVAAGELGWHYFSTGILYRYTAALQLRCDLPSPADAAKKICEEGKWNYASGSLSFGNYDLKSELYHETTTSMASKVAKDPQVRSYLLSLQRNIANDSETGMIVDGRDIGTVVFPDAKLKIFLTASVECRAARRVLQVIGGEHSHSFLKSHPLYKEIYDSIVQRDERDSGRSLAPLVKASDAVVIETSEMSKDDAIKVFVNKIKQIFPL